MSINMPQEETTSGLAALLNMDAPHIHIDPPIDGVSRMPVIIVDVVGLDARGVPMFRIATQDVNAPDGVSFEDVPRDALCYYAQSRLSD